MRFNRISKMHKDCEKLRTVDHHHLTDPGCSILMFFLKTGQTWSDGWHLSHRTRPVEDYGRMRVITSQIPPPHPAVTTVTRLSHPMRMFTYQ